MSSLSSVEYQDIIKETEILFSEAMDNQYTAISFHIFEDHKRMFGHTGLKVKFCNLEENHNTIYTFDWGMVSLLRSNVGTLNMKWLGEKANIRHQDQYKILWEIRIPIMTNDQRLELGKIMSSIGSFPKHYSFSLLQYDTTGTAMNCRAFCKWAVESMKEHIAVDVQEAKDKIDDVELDDRWNMIVLAVVAGAILVACDVRI